MFPRDLELKKWSRLASQQRDHVTCIECCKYYTVPTTASCGHTLCRSCWYGRRNCEYCGKLVEKINLKSNIPLQNLTEHVSVLIATFEDLFSLKLDEFLLDSPVEVVPEPNKNVKEWLASSQNQFSAPVTSSTQSTQGHIQTEQIPTSIQIPTTSKKLSNHREIVHVPPKQEDWDKIEEMPDAEKNTNENQNNVVGPMDIEPYEFMMADEESTSYNPRRSTRQKDNKTGNPITHHNISPHKQSEDLDKDVVKNWNKVKRIKKQFSKLNKKNRNNLNVSIEMCKKTQNKNKGVQLPAEKLFAIDNNTAQIVTSIESTLVKNKEIIEEIENISTNIITNVNTNTSRNDINTNKTKEHIADVNVNKVTEAPRVTFIKKSTLQTKPLAITDNIQIEADKSSTHNNDDIEITIKIGNTQINICIKKPDNDIQLNINSDREVQTSLGKCSFIKKVSSTTNAVNNLEQNNNSENIPNTLSAPKATVPEKSLSKTNTASADTTSARFEITKSIDFNEISEKDTNKTTQIKNIPQDIRSLRPLGIVDEILEDMDLDIFDSESVKVGNVVSLKSTKNTNSAILPSIKTTKIRTSLTNEKRDRDVNDASDLPSSKKMKLTLNKSKTITENHNNITDSENVNNEIRSPIVNNVDNIQNRSNNPKITTNISKINEQSASQKSYTNTITKPKPKADDKFSENIFSIIDNDFELKTYGDKEQGDTQTTNKPQITPDLDVMELCTPIQDDDSDKSVVEDTPQKNTSFTKKKNKNETTMKVNLKKQTQDIQNNNDTEVITVISLLDSTGDSTKNNLTVLETNRLTLETPGTISKFVDKITHKSTPMARKSLNFNNENCTDLTISPSSLVLAQTTQEKEFLSKAFESTLDYDIRNNRIKYCLAGSCLSTTEQAKVKYLCSKRNWIYVNKYTTDLTHLVVGVDEDNKSQRSVKYICALAGGKWIISYEWIEKCLETNDVVDEMQFEALDATGEPGPRRSRLAKQKLFTGISFYCMPPYNVLDVDTLKDILLASGGTVVSAARDARAGEQPALLLAEPEDTQEDRFTYLAMELNVVPINYEWVLECLGNYSLSSIYELLLCPESLLPPIISKWPTELIRRDDE